MKKLIIALVKFQKEVAVIPKNKINPFFGSKYAELSTVIDTCSPSLNKNGLAVIQTLKAEDNRNILVTILCHESGDTLESNIYLPDISDPQKLTAAITYLRRSAYLAITGLVADEDDDGNSVSSPVNNSSQTVQLGANNHKTFPASEAQKGALKKMGIDFKPDISKEEASKLIAQGKR